MIHRPGEIDSLLTHTYLCHRTSIQRSCRLGNGFLTIVDDSFRGLEKEEVSSKTLTNMVVTRTDANESVWAQKITHTGLMGY